MSTSGAPEPRSRASLADAPGCRARSACLAILLSAVALGPVPTATGEPRRHVLEVRGDGFSFEVREPSGWFVDSTIAGEFGASVICYPVNRDPHLPGTPLIRVVVEKKSGEGMAANVEQAMDRDRARYGTVELRDDAASHPRYRAQAKLLCVPGKLCEYVTYLDPGPGSSSILSVILARPGHAATANELAAYRRVVASLRAD